MPVVLLKLLLRADCSADLMYLKMAKRRRMATVAINHEIRNDSTRHHKKPRRANLAEKYLNLDGQH